MQEDAGNEYQDLTVGENFTIQLVANQYSHEADSFGSFYDDPNYLGNLSGTWMISAPVTVEDGMVAETVIIGSEDDLFTAEVPAGVKVEEGIEELVLVISTQTAHEADVQLEAGQIGLSLEVHVEGVAADNTTPITIELGKIAPAGLYEGNIVLYHVENGVTNRMTQVANMDVLDAHNEFYYNGQTGEVTIMMATFSEVYAAVSIDNPWNGTDAAYAWYTGVTNGTYTLTTAADLFGFAQIVGGMAEGIPQDSFEGETVTLGSDINLGGKIWYPIGYNSNDGNYDFTNTAITSDLLPFKGTFDGNGHTIANFYQSTWEMKGDNTHYPLTEQRYDEGMGLFGVIENGTVKNLVIDGMVAEGEFTDVGCVTAYARGTCTFDNIRITNVSCYSYNCRTAGIVAYDWIGEEGSNFTFSKIEIDPSSTFGALWGSWDVACAGILGYKNDASKVKFVNCEVGCELDVFNDVCANYQYYDYRYAGMMIGTVGKDDDPSDQVANGNIQFENCSVHYGDWVNHYHCELEANTTASYTDDYQMSRLDKIYNIAEIQNDNGSWKKTGNFVLMSNKTCYHIVNNNGTLEQYIHTPEEDKQVVHTVFNQLFTGYGWGATSAATGVNVTETKYIISYAYGDKVYDVTYVTDNSKAVSTANAKLEAWAESLLNGKYEFDYWMNAGSTRVDTVPEGNTENIVLYPSFRGIYTATFVDLDGNVLATETFTNSAYSNVTGMQLSVPEIEYCEFDHWEVRSAGAATTTSREEFNFKNCKNDITIYPVYTYDGNLNLMPHDSDGDGSTNYYTVEAASGLSGDVVIPGKVGNIPVTSITDLSSDWLNTKVNSIEIKDGVQAIGANAFAMTMGLKEVTIPTSVTSIGKNAFASTIGGAIVRKEITINYAGTWEEFQSICASGWESGLIDGTKVVCTDGTATLKTSTFLGYGSYEWTFVKK